MLDNNMQNPYGLILKPQPIGSPTYDILFGEKGEAEPINWKQYLSPRERQYNVPFCVSFSCLNCQEAIANKENLHINLSDRDLGVISKTTKEGNDMHTVAETFRTLGVVKETDCPWRDNWLTDLSHWNDIFNLSDIPADARMYKGGDHSFIYSKDLIKSALAYSPIQLAVAVGDNWETDDPITNPKNIRAYHAITCYWYSEAEGYFFQDSCGAEWKRLSPDYKINGAKSFRLLPNNWRDLQTMLKLVKYNKDYFVEFNGKNYYIPSMEILNYGKTNNIFAQEVESVDPIVPDGQWIEYGWQA